MMPTSLVGASDLGHDGSMSGSRRRVTLVPQTAMEATSTTAVATRTRWAALDLSAIAAFGLGAVLVGWVAADDGGWWPETWAWTALVTLGASVVILLVRDRPLGWLELAFLSGLLAFGAWTALSALWSPSVPSTVDETQRVLAYVGSVLLAVLVVERRTVAASARRCPDRDRRDRRAMHSQRGSCPIGSVTSTLRASATTAFRSR